MPITAFASIVDYDDEPEIQQECEERSDYDNLCSGTNGATGIPFCDQSNSTQRAQQFPNLTNPSHCLSREYNPIEFCEQFDDLTSTYEYCRNVPGSEEYFEYAKMKMTIAFLYIGKDVLKVIIVQMRMRQDNVIQMMRDVTLGL